MTCEVPDKMANGYRYKVGVSDDKQAAVAHTYSVHPDPAGHGLKCTLRLLVCRMDSSGKLGLIPLRYRVPIFTV